MLPLSMRKANLERLLARRPEGVFVNLFERGELGPVSDDPIDLDAIKRAHVARCSQPRAIFASDALVQLPSLSAPTLPR
ncbi:hypothetical protein ACVWYH_000880 [Bradyrhizobium sp. GM24.11]